MNLFDFSKYKKALILGTGGGNDIVSATLIALYLQKQGLETDVAGMLSPVARHTFEGNLEKEINLVSVNSLRYIDFPKQEREVSFIDRYLPDANNIEKLDIGNFYNFSLKFGIERLNNTLNKHIEKEGYDVFVAVDVGGDILGRDGKDKYILSPMMDFSSLTLLGRTSIDSFLVEFGLLTDGENRQDNMDEILEEIKDKGIILGESKISKDEEEVKRFTKLYSDYIKCEREGGTIPRFLQSLNNQKNISLKNRIRYKILPKTWDSYHNLILPKKYAGKVLILDGKKMAHARSTLTSSYDNPLEQFIKIKSNNYYWKTEADLLYMWSGDNWTTQTKKGKSMFLLYPSEQIPHTQRKEIISYGVENSQSDLILLQESDSVHVRDSNHFIYHCDQFDLLSREPSSEFKGIAKQITNYQKKR